jgi:hypothetical protein
MEATWPSLVLNFPKDPSSTHIPVLRHLGQDPKIRHVVELGVGAFSTFSFLDRECFPHLETLTSYESDSAWASPILNEKYGDDRFFLFLHAKPLSASVRAGAVDLSGADLVFVDHTHDDIERDATIRAITGS